MNLHRSLAPTAVRCRSLQVWGWTVHTDFEGDTDFGAGASKCGGGQFRVWSMQVPPTVPEPPSVGVDSSKRTSGMGRKRVPEPPSVGVDSSMAGYLRFRWRCRSLQVWGWTVHRKSRRSRRLRCRSLQVWGWTVHIRVRGQGGYGAGASKCGGGQFIRGVHRARIGAGASKGGGHRSGAARRRRLPG